MSDFFARHRLVQAQSVRGEDAVYFRAGSTVGIAMRVVRSIEAPDPTAGLSRAPAGRVVMAMIPLAALPQRPEPGDTIQIGTDGWRVEQPAADAVNSAWTVYLNASKPRA